jgi:O-antigen ligase
MAKGQRFPEPTAPPIPLSILILWIFGGTAFTGIVYLFTPFTHNLDDIKVTFQYTLAPMVWGFFAVALWCGHIRRIHPAIVLSLSAFMLVMLLATLLAEFPWRAWHDLGYQLTVMAPFLVVVGTATNERRFRNMCLFYFLIGCGTIVFGLFHYFGGIGYVFRQFYPTGVPTGGYGPLYTLLYTLRLNGDMLSTILNRDFYAAYLIMVVPLGVALTIGYQHLRAKLFFLLMFFLGCVCIILAASKDSYMGLFLVLVIFLGLFAARRDWHLVPHVLWAVWIIGGIVVFGTALYVIRDRFANFGYTVNSSFMSRGVIWGGSLKVFCDLARPLGTFIKFLLVGGGPGAFYLMFPHYRHPDYNLYQISHITIFSHNQYLDLTAEEGILGFITFMFFLGAVIWLVLREAWRKLHHPLNVYLIHRRRQLPEYLQPWDSLDGLRFCLLLPPGSDRCRFSSDTHRAGSGTD